MSVCYFVPTDQEQAQTVEEAEGGTSTEETAQAQSSQQTLEQFWAKVTEDIMNVTAEDFKTQTLPLARIKKIMKLDEEVKMISAEAPVLFAKAAEIFIHELTLRAWSHTEDNKRRTLQRNDIAMAISNSDQFDFLIDIVPRHEIKPQKGRFESVWTPGKPDPTPQHQQATVQTAQQPQLVLQPCSQIVQPSDNAASTSSNVQTPVTLVRHVVAPNQTADVQNIPSQIQLTPAQLNMIRLQIQNNPSQPIIIQAQQSPQIIQVTSQAQHQPQQQVFLAQVANSQEES